MQECFSSNYKLLYFLLPMVQELKFNQDQTLRQEQVLNALQIHSLDLLMAPIIELQSKINYELETNPVLELESDNQVLQNKTNTEDTEDEIDTTDGSAEKEEQLLVESGNIEAENITEDDPESIMEEKDVFEIRKDRYEMSTAFSDDEKREHFFNSIIEEQTIQEDLKLQLNFLNVNEDIKKYCELIIGSLDEQGFFRSSLADLAVIAGVDIIEMENALNIVKSLDPPGVGAKNIKECLLLQLKRKNESNTILAEIIKYHLDDIASNHLPQAAKALNLTIDEFKKAVEKIKNLNPYPYAGTQYGEDPLFVIPELTIEKETDKYIISFDKEYQIRLKISKEYVDMLQQSDLSKETREYIKEKISSASNIIKILDQRQSTISKIADIIVDVQYDFLEKGTLFLKPLTMRQVADKIGVHETTVSRAVSNKYVQTPQGLFPLKYFFSAGFQSDDGELIASKSIMEKIKNIIDSENSEKPYSDDEITKMLNTNGIPVARRTVAKYREELGLPSSRLRKEYN